jgi:hypothetical protein
VSLTLRNLELIPVNEIARFHMGVDGSGSAELAVSVRGKVYVTAPNYVIPGLNLVSLWRKDLGHRFMFQM